MRLPQGSGVSGEAPIRFRFEELGVAVVEWDGQAPLAAAIEEVRSFRRFARHAFG